MKKIMRTFSAATVVLLATTNLCLAQYDTPREYEPTEIRAISAGLSMMEFNPKTANAESDSIGIRFRSLIPLLDFRSGLMDIHFGYTRFSQNNHMEPAILVGMNVGTEIPVLGKRSSTLLLPLLIAADFTRADAEGVARNSFNVASVGIGLGLKYRITNQSLDAWLSAVAVAHYATQGFSVNAGFSGAILAELIAYFPAVPVGDGICVGYRFRFQSWSMPDANLNYRMILHGPSIGIAF